MSDDGQKPRASRARSARGRGAEGTGVRAWVSAALGTFVLVSGGFLLGVVVGVVWEEPDLIATHLLGQSEELAWQPAVPAGGVSAAPSLAAKQAPDRAEARSQTATPADPRERATVHSSARSGPAGEPSRATPARSVAGVSAVGAVRTAPPGWAIQVGAFSRSSSADALAESLVSKGFETYLVPSASHGRWRVRVGPLATKSEAQRVARRLEREESLSTWVLSEGGG